MLPIDVIELIFSYLNIEEQYELAHKLYFKKKTVLSWKVLPKVTIVGIVTASEIEQYGRRTNIDFNFKITKIIDDDPVKNKKYVKKMYGNDEYIEEGLTYQMAAEITDRFFEGWFQINDIFAEEVVYDLKQITIISTKK